MPAPEKIVGTLSNVGPLHDFEWVHFDPDLPAETPTVVFANGETAYLEHGDANHGRYLQMLRTLLDLKRPAYVELAAGTRAVRRALIPRVGRVVAMTPRRATGEFDIEVDESAAVLVAGTPTLDDPEPEKVVSFLRQALKDGQPRVITADPNSHVILDARLPDHAIPPRMPCLAAAVPRDLITSLLSVEEKAVKDFFANLLQSECTLPKANGDCLPFQYPDDFCWAMASRICELLGQNDIAAGKAWLLGRLRFETPNAPGCVIEWSFHVAAFVRIGKTSDPNDVLIIDPAVFFDEGPTPLAEWRRRVHGDNATLLLSDHRPYRLNRSSGICEHPGEAEGDLEMARNELRCRAHGNTAPPPFQCNQI
jgi:hypothetical protein